MQFFALVFVLTVPFWILSAVTNFVLLPGLPIAAFAVVCPAIAALGLSYRAGGASAAATLARRALDVKRMGSRLWYAPMLLISPAISVAAFAFMRSTGNHVPAPQITLLSVLALSALFMIGALSEELGWSGYATEPSQERWGALAGSLVLGAVWAAWHFVALLEVGRPVKWIAWWSLGTIATRVIMVWLYGRTGRSVFGAALYHASTNLCWQMFPVHGSYFDVRINGVLTASLAAVLALCSRVADGRSAPGCGSTRPSTPNE